MIGEYNQDLHTKMMSVMMADLRSGHQNTKIDPLARILMHKRREREGSICNTNLE
jgi:hypothetical protein